MSFITFVFWSICQHIFIILSSKVVLSLIYEVKLTNGFYLGVGCLKNISMSSFVESSSATMQTYDSDRLLKPTSDVRKLTDLFNIINSFI